MTQEEQQRIISVLNSIGEQGSIAISKSVEEWAKSGLDEKDRQSMYMCDRGLYVQYRVAGVDEWFFLKQIPFTHFTWETTSDWRNRTEAVKYLFYWGNLESSNKMGDVVALRYMPYIHVNGENLLKEDEITLFECTDTGERRQWNQLEIRRYDNPGSTDRDYSIDRPDIHEGDNICWYEPWHFSLGDDAECPVAPIIVEHADSFNLVLRYREQLFTLSMQPGMPHSATLETDVHVTPTHNWDGIWMRPPFKFDLVADISWKEELYGSDNRQIFSQKPHFVRTSDLPPGVRTMQQIDHDAWEEAARHRND
ncbi:MAG: hypothetical protein IJ776_06690 [Paludibacteraceae bacterium]|nr:hypothetical protein [Paludibacteraceae bacterium]